MARTDADLSHDRQVITYDLYGHGDSPAPCEPPSLALFARQFAGVMAHFDLPHAIVAGFSLGGMIARRIAMDMPHLVSGLAILHSPHARTGAEQDAIQARVQQAEAAGRGQRSRRHSNAGSPLVFTLPIRQ